MESRLSGSDNTETVKLRERQKQLALLYRRIGAHVTRLHRPLCSPVQFPANGLLTDCRQESYLSSRRSVLSGANTAAGNWFKVWSCMGKCVPLDPA